MATIAHHVYSNYDPEEDRERLEGETGQLDAEADKADPWLTEKPFRTSRRIARPPMFVAATIDYNEWGSTTLGEASKAGRGKEEGDGETESIGGWYRSLARKTPADTPQSSTPITQTPPAQEAQQSKKKHIRRDRNNWFISRALEASDSTSNDSNSQSPSGSGANSPAPPTPTLADILARDPPPLPTEQKYTPPVWLAIGPSNKGYEMLQKSGWEEGEALGRASRNRAGLGYSAKGNENDIDLSEEAEGIEALKQELIDITTMDDEVIDLTGLDDESPGLEDVFRRPTGLIPAQNSTVLPQNARLAMGMDHAPRALLTPLPTVLKADRLGIGLKAKTVGSGIDREPVKRVTHGRAALAAHIRASEERRKMKKLVGRGRRGFEHVKKKDEEGRKNLLAYLNT